MEQTGTGTEHEVATAPRGGGRWARHPSPREYVRIAVILAIVTAAEVAIYYIDWIHEQGLLIPLLFLFAVIKFSLVVLWFMHLRFDSRTYARFFLMGLAGALTLYIAVLLMFRTFAG
ncbi:MAG TPA: cytochrome C oxidase subunit IV family protein [Actinomycetota bacterium]|nr:cytochrome C oxidase subunit IV family protein [Actinomycetota bacterium]